MDSINLTDEASNILSLSPSLSPEALSASPLESMPLLDETSKKHSHRSVSTSSLDSMLPGETSESKAVSWCPVELVETEASIEISDTVLFNRSSKSHSNVPKESLPPQTSILLESNAESWCPVESSLDTARVPLMKDIPLFNCPMDTVFGRYSESPKNVSGASSPNESMLLELWESCEEPSYTIESIKISNTLLFNSTSEIPAKFPKEHMIEASCANDDTHLFGRYSESPKNVSRATSPKDVTLPDKKDKIESSIMVDRDHYVREFFLHAPLNEAVLGGDEQNVSQVLGGDEQKVSQVSTCCNPEMRLLQPTVAHIAARLGQHSVLEHLLSRYPSLFNMKDGRGDTPLHVAARTGQLDIVKNLLDLNSRLVSGTMGCGIPTEVAGLTTTNMKGNTALHEALENSHEDVAKLLVTTHPGISYLRNKKGKTPAYLAAEAGLLQLLQHMFGLLEDSLIHLQCHAMTPLHAAIIRRHPESIEWVLERKPQLIQVTDENGRNPLHYAASMGYCDGLRQLLKKNSQVAYQPDMFGHYPIHEAASAGHIDVIQLLLEFCPGSWALLGKGGQNVLHVAAQSGKENVLRYFLKSKAFEMLINDLDESGNTPLHLATEHNHIKAVRILTRDNRVNKSICNNDGLTALDVAEKNIVTGGSFRKFLTLTTLRIANAPRARNIDVFDDKYRNRYILPPPKREGFKDEVNFLLLVSTLVTTVTFAAGFTIPGGLTGDGIAIMLANTKFKVFVICDSIALFCSILAVVSLIWTQVGDVKMIRSIANLTVLLLGISLSMMVIAFSAGLYIVTSQLHWLASAVLIMTTVFLICTLIVLFALRMPMLTQYRLVQRISFYFFYLLASVTGSATDDGDSDIREDYVWKEEKKGRNKYNKTNLC